ncbi:MULTISPECIES: ABC transporter ATP-binding protein [Mycobacteriaceae]|uniref:ABC transporter ATP-binding protein n=1 Tax=Mycobacteriaceae TaxID=1762 RepID=UPI0003760E7D|nr:MULTISPECIES: ABC transporter ATP-binding protein [Mycobacteriaceae]AHC27379.2 iron-dicitrate transporter ATP-binding subunit [Mycolicibacterium neoaurum VKM Ac-1815D]AMO07600.1 iron-dicitrate transporter ATP-binding subunit [Mycolicibacterium neoaurum]AXK74008.1 ABC transporter ATP-binding protein [Mycolicibacterium neoaurum]KJQ51552.1 iron-dicitrate transporter ATP-binding subunit [Mycolicibacterium neoaurum]KUM08870.1 iron-dicitrate transporter ATP-binding subunit [Mycolicibacterium neoa
MATLRAQDLTLGYSDTPIVAGLNAEITEGAITAIVGPNACGKSTLLRGLARLLRPAGGQVLLDGADISSLRTKDVARKLGLLPQSSIAPEGITVADLVARGRFPHQRALRQFTRDDEVAVAEAMAATGVTALSGRAVDELSGGQRQRVWVAMVLAQQTPLILLDEPTTFLDIAHQIELLDLFAELNDTQGRTIVAVLHDLNHACRFADQIIAMKAGRIVAQGEPARVITADLVEDVYGMKCQIIDDPETGTPLVVPRASPRDRARRR